MSPNKKERSNMIIQTNYAFESDLANSWQVVPRAGTGSSAVAVVCCSTKRKQWSYMLHVNSNILIRYSWRLPIGDFPTITVPIRRDLHGGRDNIEQLGQVFLHGVDLNSWFFLWFHPCICEIRHIKQMTVA